MTPLNEMANPNDRSNNGAANIFSRDLMSNAKKHLEFLKAIHEYYIAYHDHDLNKGSHESLRRYQELWLPLVAAHTTQQLYPPPDIAWLWHCHRLAPKHYADYCHDNFGGRIIEAHPPFEMAHPMRIATAAHIEFFQSTMDAWTEMYPHEAFFLPTNGATTCPETKTNEHSTSTSTLLQGFDLLGSIHRQADFLWQVSGERFGDDDFLKDGVQNYYRFLKLRPHAAKQGMVLIPTYQIDLMWHTHILSSIEMYNKDCIRIMNGTLHHDDSLTDRSEGGILETSFTRTKSLWMKHYGTEYVVAGGMYRGEPPPEYYTDQWRSYDDSLPATITNFALIGKVGASSIGKVETVPTQWAPLDGTASDGSPAFIASPYKSIDAIKPLQHKSKYVLGRYGRKTGYYHIETRAANAILKNRVDARLRTYESSLAFEKGCCGERNPHKIDGLERICSELFQCQTLLRERLDAPVPWGSTRTKTVGSTKVNGDNNTWMYPPVIYSSAGGACGGMVCSTGTFHSFSFHIIAVHCMFSSLKLYPSE